MRRRILDVMSMHNRQVDGTSVLGTESYKQIGGHIMGHASPTRYILHKEDIHTYH